MRGLVAVALVLGLAACQPNPDKDIPQAGWTEAARAECIAAGGTPTRGLSGPVCSMPSPDAGASCQSSDECSGFCLAETRTCSPVTPFFGCHSILEDNEVVEICID